MFHLKLTRIRQNQHIFFPILDVALNGVNYLYHIFVSWCLIPSDYGILNSLLAVMAILFVSGISLQLHTSKVMAEKQYHIVSNIYQAVHYITLGLSLALLVAIPPMMNLLRTDPLSLFLVILIIAINNYLSVYRGILQGEKQFLALNYNFYIEVFFKFLALYLLFPRFASVQSGLLSILVGMVAAFVHGYFRKKLVYYQVDQSRKKEFSKIIKQIAAIFAANFFIYFFTNIDMIVVNYYLPEESGIFAVVLRYAQILLFTIFSIITVFLPYLSAAKGDLPKFRKILAFLFALVTFTGLMAVLVYSWLLPPTVEWFFGAQYQEAGQYLFLGAIAYLFFIYAFTFINVYIVLEKNIYLWFLAIFGVVFLALLMQFHQSIRQILYVEIGSFGALFLFLFIYYLRKGGRHEIPVGESVS